MAGTCLEDEMGTVAESIERPGRDSAHSESAEPLGERTKPALPDPPKACGKLRGQMDLSGLIGADTWMVGKYEW